MSYIWQKVYAHKFEHKKNCNFEKLMQGFSVMRLSFGKEAITAQDSDDEYYNEDVLPLKFCPICGIDINIETILIKEIKKRFAELINKAGLITGQKIYIKPRIKGGKGSVSIISNIRYDKHFDRLLFENWTRQNGYTMGAWALEDIEPYTNQPQ